MESRVIRGTKSFRGDAEHGRLTARWGAELTETSLEIIARRRRVADDDLLVTPPNARISHSAQSTFHCDDSAYLGLVPHEFAASNMLALAGGFTEQWPVQA